MESYAVIPGTFYASAGTFTAAYGSGYNDLKQVALHGVATTVSGATRITTLDSQAIDPIYLIPNQSTETITYRSRGLVMREEAYVYTGSVFNLVGTATYTYTPSGKLLTKVAANGATTSMEYTNEFMTARTDAAGTRTEYTPDALLRVATVTKKGVSGNTNYTDQGDITTTYTYDGDSNIVTATTNSALTKSTVYNQAGQPTSSTAPGNYTTIYSYPSANVNTARIPGGSAQTTPLSSDGQVASVTGTAQVPVYYSYSVASAYSVSQTKYLFSSTSNNYVTVFMDGLGRTTSMSSPNPATNSTGFSTTLYTYNVLGQLSE